MKGLILASVSAIALGLGGAGTAHAWGYSGGYSGSTTGPNAQTYYPNFSSSSGYTTYPRYIPGNIAAAGNTAGGAFAFLTHAQVWRAQQELARAGDYTGPVNGTLDPATSYALARYQSQHNLPTTGGFNPPTMASLGLGTAPPYYYTANHSGTPYAYQGSNFQGAEAPSGAGGTMAPNAPTHPGYGGNAEQGSSPQGAAMPSQMHRNAMTGQMPPTNATGGQGMETGGPNLPTNTNAGAAAPIPGNEAGGQGMGNGGPNLPTNTNAGAAAPGPGPAPQH